MSYLWIRMIAAGLITAAVILIIAFRMPRPRCKACGAALPRFRTPGSGGQALHGGWTCPDCGEKLDRTGEPIGD